VLLILTSITLITLDFRGDGGLLGSARDAAANVLSPVRSLAETVTEPISDAWNGATGYDDLEAENRDLRTELALIRQRELAISDLERRVGEMEDLLGLKDTLGVETVGARVISAPVSNFERSIDIDVGSADGIVEGMPVMAPGGLLGRIDAVGDDRSRVQILIDPAFAVGVRLARSGETGVAGGAGPTAPLTVDFIDPATPIVAGETVVTSGLEGSAFPPGLVVGTVLSAEVDPVERSVSVDVVPSADLNRLDLVDVLLYTAPASSLPSADDLEGPR
jgi:rod shape-determining protein MreC